MMARSVALLLALLLALLAPPVAGQQEPGPCLAPAGPLPCDFMGNARQKCPLTSDAVARMLPIDPRVHQPKPPCQPGQDPERDSCWTKATAACDGGCDPPLICDVNGIMGKNGTCVECPPGRCCTTMPAKLALRQMVKALGASLPGFQPSVVGPTLVNLRPCPRNYKCDVGKVDDFLRKTDAR